MDDPASGEFEGLLALARSSAQTLVAARVPAQSAALDGWLAIQRLDHRRIVHAPDGGSPSHEEAFYEQIWLTRDGTLRRARRSQTRDGPPEIRPGAAIVSAGDLAGARWDGDYAPTTHRLGLVETIVHDEPAGRRETPETRIAAALENMTASLTGSGARRWRLERRKDRRTKLATGVVVTIGWVTLVLMVMFVAWLWGILTDPGWTVGVTSF